MNDAQDSKMKELNLLERSALVVEDFDDATAALRALGKLDKYRARDTALKVLLENIGDVFYQATAFDSLYRVSLSDALEYIEKRADTESYYVLGAMLMCVAEDVGAIEKRNEIMEAVDTLRHALSIRSIEDLNKIQMQKKFFEDAYL